MKLILLVFFPLGLFAQTSSDTLDLRELVREALINNPTLQAFELNRDLMEARAEGSGLLGDPELTYMRDEIPDFRWKDARMQRIELMQMIPFPGKLSTESAIAEIQAEHAHHEHMEKANEVLARLRSAYYELWYVQQSVALNRENTRLLNQFAKIAQTRLGVGQASQQEVLKAFVEIAKLDNQLITLRQQELSAKAMLHALLNRDPRDSLGIAIVPAVVDSLLPLDSLVLLSMKFRGMILHDSLSIAESEQMLSLARKAYLPDFKVGAGYITMPGSHQPAWMVSVGVNLPIAPWSLSRISARVDEETIAIDKARSTLAASRTMIRSTIRDLYFKAQSLLRQLENYTHVIVPQSEQALHASMMAYQTGRTDFLMLIDSYRMLLELSMEKLMLRMHYEQALASLKQEVGYAGICETRSERNKQ